MKLIIQRVTEASASVDGEIIGSIGRGVCVLVGIHKTDTRKDLDYLVRKLLNFRIFGDETQDGGKRWNKSVKDLDYEILCCSQFTLYHTMKGNKPDFHQAMSGDVANQFFHDFVDELKKAYSPDKVKQGKFGAKSIINIHNDGPVTMELESMTKSSSEKSSTSTEKK